MPVVNSAQRHGTVDFEPILVEIIPAPGRLPVFGLFHPCVDVKGNPIERGGTLEIPHARVYAENLPACLWIIYGGEVKPSVFWKNIRWRVI